MCVIVKSLVNIQINGLIDISVYFCYTSYNVHQHNVSLVLIVTVLPNDHFMFAYKTVRIRTKYHIVQY